MKKSQCLFYKHAICCMHVIHSTFKKRLNIEFPFFLMDGIKFVSRFARKYSVFLGVLTNDFNAILVGKLFLNVQVYITYFKRRN